MVMRLTIILLALVCSACSSYALKPYKMDIQQGNVVTSKMMLQLRPGMNKSQVRFIMGTPLIQDSFHRDRWDYFYQMRKDGKVIEQRRVILDFEGDALKRVRGDVIPAGTGDVAEPAPVTAPSGKSKPKSEEKGLLDKLKFWKSDEADAAKPQAAPSELILPAATPVEQTPAPENAQPAAETRSAPEAKPAPEPEAAPAAAPVAPAPEAASPASAPQTEAPVQQEAPQQQAPQSETPKAAPEAAKKPEPAPAKSEPVKPAESKPAAQPASKAEAKPATKPAAKPAPVEEDLPPEDAPGYFERMLEKIGF